MLTLLLATALVLFLLFNFFRKTKQYPPGPTPIPFIGNVVQVFREGFGNTGGIRPLLHKWKKQYGPVYTVWFGPIPVVFIVDYGLAIESHVKKGQHFVDRQDFYIQNISRQGRGIVASNGHHWTEQRRFALQTLRDFGLGRNVMEERIMLELDYRMKLLDREIEKAGGGLLWDPRDFCELTVGNIINRMLFSERFTDEKEKEFFRLKRRLDDFVENSSVVDGLLTESNRNWPFFNRRYRQMKEAEETILDFIRQQIDDKKRHGHEGECEDFVETYLSKMKTGEFSEEFTEDALLISLFDLWVAGQESTSNTLHWALVYLTRYPKTLRKLQDELDTLTGRTRALSLKDRPIAPYLNAIVQEVLRVSALLPLNVLARISTQTEDVHFSGYTIPKGTAISVQLAVIMGEEKSFKNPEEFDPDRYANGDPEQQVIAFGVGKRACPGESLARAEMFMLIGTMALNYEMEAIPGREPEMRANRENLVLRKPRPYQIQISKRF